MSDLTLTGGLIYDGTGAPPFRGDIGVSDGRIEAVGTDLNFGSTVLDCHGLCIAPGFIDVHTHDDFAIAARPGMDFKVGGGVTTSIIGNCGEGPAPFPASLGALNGQFPAESLPQWVNYRAYLDWVRANPAALNVAALVGHGTIRTAVLDALPHGSSSDHEHAVWAEIEAGLDAGAIGASLGLFYEPGRSATRRELVGIAQIIANRNAVLAVHLRDEGAGLLSAIDEVLSLAAETGVKLQISHHKAAGRPNHGLVYHSLKRLAAARDNGIEVNCDQYPYTSGSTHLSDVVANPDGVGGFDPDAIKICYTADYSIAGVSVAQLARERAVAPWTVAVDIAAMAPETTVILETMAEADVRTVMRDSHTMIGSDGLPNEHDMSHPRLSGTFARVIGRYARDLGVIGISEAIHRMTGLAASTFGLDDRGTLAVGKAADLVVFDIAKLNDFPRVATPVGIPHVIVNGRPVIRDGVPTGERPGVVLTGNEQSEAPR